uniref:Protein rhomboid n=1 Tax=Aceria tosichella TaxID=561515 RepID=A0A6G1SE68_9ACAR
MISDIELGPDGEFYIRRKITAAELESLRRLSAGTELDKINIFLEPISTTTSTSSRRQKQLTYKYPPFFITFVSLFQLVSFVYYALRSDELLTLTGPIPFESKLIYNPNRRYEIWRYLTYMFIHAGFWHISFNIVMQMIVGIPLELVHKFERIFLIYIGGVIAGSLGNSVADPHSYLAGASSGCYALVAAHVANLILNWGEIRGACCRLILVSTFIFIDLGIAIYERHFKISLTQHRTSYGGHLAGTISGFLLGLVCLRNICVHSWERELKKWAATIYIGFMLTAITFNITNTDYFPPPDKRDLTWTSSPFGYEREH